jgi:putative colanic acid biosynthesis glycosyltransferase
VRGESRNALPDLDDPMSSGPPLLVSVITVVRNDLAGLKRTRESVASQSCPDAEHVIWDGASTDGTVDYLRGLPPNRLRWQSAADGGIYDAMNKATELAQGQVLLYLNAGDCLADPEVLEWVAAQWRQAPWAVAFGVLRRWRVDAFVDVADRRPFDLQRLAAGRTWVPHQATFFSRDAVLAAGGYDLEAGLAADQDLILRLTMTDPPLEWDRVIADFQLDGVHSRASVRSRELEWYRIRTKNLARSPWQNRADRGLTEVRIWMKSARRGLRPLRSIQRRFSPTRSNA